MRLQRVSKISPQNKSAENSEILREIYMSQKKDKIIGDLRLI